MLATVDSRVPLSLLEAVRDIDRPVDQHETEFVDELRNKRLGLSETVYSQITRYKEAVRRNRRTPQEETTGLARLIGRRPDAEPVFREAGRYLARAMYLTVPAHTRGMLRLLPGLVARPIAVRRAKKLATRYWNGRLRRVGGVLLLDVPRPATLDTAAASIGCTFYESSLRELMMLLIGAIGPVEHVRCSSRGEGTCEWRADWRTFDRSHAGQLPD